jgi:hypothetical protein
MLAPSDQMPNCVRPPLFRRLVSQHPVPPTPKEPTLSGIEGSKSPSRLPARFFAASIAFVVADQLGSLRVPSSRLTLRRCKIHFMLRAAVLYSLLRRIQHFSTTGHPEALGACYVVSRQLPQPDFRRLANDSLAGHISDGLASPGSPRYPSFSKSQTRSVTWEPPTFSFMGLRQVIATAPRPAAGGSDRYLPPAPYESER